MAKGFLVTKLKYGIPEKGVYVAKRDKGIKVAECRINLKDISLLELIPEKNFNQHQLDRSKKVRIWLESGLRLLNSHSSISMDLAKNPELKVEFLENHFSLMNVKSSSTIQCDIDIADELDDPGIEVLYSLGLLHTFCSINGMEEKIALDNVITFYENLRDEDKDVLLKILSHPQIDTGKIFM